MSYGKRQSDLAEQYRDWMTHPVTVALFSAMKAEREMYSMVALRVGTSSSDTEQFKGRIAQIDSDMSLHVHCYHALDAEIVKEQQEEKQKEMDQQNGSGSNDRAGDSIQAGEGEDSDIGGRLY